MSRRDKGAAYSDRLVERRAAAVEQAAQAADPAAKLLELTKTAEFAAFNVNSPNNQKRLAERLGQ